ncbi:MAG: SlyX family protein [Proteobacteria bacterium]|jgi:uncharacterized coiled-coil protein SlyX|nr:SlyX family protein [Pseudomonadota bacterium]
MRKKQRIEELEIKVSFQEHTITQLDQVIRELRDEVDRLNTDVRSLREVVETEFNEVVDEKPPHY